VKSAKNSFYIIAFTLFDLIFSKTIFFSLFF
jgi:hypothetical protein